MKTAKKKRVNHQLIDFNKVNDYVSNLFQSDVHASRIVSMSNAVIGVMAASSLAISLMGLGLSMVRGSVTKHAVKQVDRLMSNTRFVVWDYFGHWVDELVGARHEIIVAMDWTEFDKDNHTTLALYLVTQHGRATPLMWKTYNKSTLKNNRVNYEKTLLCHLKAHLPKETKVTILADRGFGYVELYKELSRLKFDFVIRFKGNVKVTNSQGIVHDAKDWVGKGGRARRLNNAVVTASSTYPMPVVVCVHAKKMKEAWCLVTNKTALTTKEIINYYAKRWSIEPTFRDQKNIRFGMGMYNVSVSTPERRDRLFFIAAVACVLLTVLGAASEAIGMDKMLRANTVKRRTHSLFRQGQMLTALIPNMAEEQLEKLMTKFNELLMQRKTFVDILSFV